MKILYILILTVYLVSLFFIFIYSLIQLHLVFKYKRCRKECMDAISDPNEEKPMVTIQLPVYNEMYVVERLIEKVSGFNYPKDRFEIQVLDDSTDESFEIAAKKVAEVKERGINIEHIKRPLREGFKAGALQYGLKTAKGDFIAIFDADFLPEEDFLNKTVHYFKNPEIGMVQTRWGHINESYSILTKAQAFQLNAHFTVEQKGRNESGYFINFNGTGGIWRKEAIEDAGGWESDTITEDLDLSYRSQLKGWKFKFLEDVVSPAELPAAMSAIKSQQFRWTKGGAETARKHIKNILKADISFGQKFHGIAHLLNSSVFIFVLLTALSSIPMMWAKNQLPEYSLYFNLGSFFFIAFIILIIFYVTSIQVITTSKNKTWYFLSMFPSFLCLSMGMAFHNTLAVLKGYAGKQTDFIRTPKFNIKDLSDKWSSNKYLHGKFDAVTFFEGVLFLYFLFGIGYGIYLGDYGFLPFHLMLSIGYGLIFYYSIYHARLTKMA